MSQPFLQRPAEDLRHAGGREARARAVARIQLERVARSNAPGAAGALRRLRLLLWSVADVAGVLFVVLFLLWDARDVVVLLLLWGLRDPNFYQPAHLLALVKCRLLRTAGVYDEDRIIDGDRCLGDVRREDHLPN